MDSIEKALNKLSKGERQKLKEILLRIKSGDLAGLDMKKLKGREDIFRIRKGKMRIIFYKKEESVNILSLERRSGKNY